MFLEIFAPLAKKFTLPAAVTAVKNFTSACFTDIIRYVIFFGAFPKANQGWKYHLKCNTVRMSCSSFKSPGWNAAPFVGALLLLLTTPCFPLQERIVEWCGLGWRSAFVGSLVDILQLMNNEYDLLLCWQINCWLSNNYDSITPLTSLLPNMLYATTAAILPNMFYMQKDGR